MKRQDTIAALVILAVVCLLMLWGEKACAQEPGVIYQCSDGRNLCLDGKALPPMPDLNGKCVTIDRKHWKWVPCKLTSFTAKTTSTVGPEHHCPCLGDAIEQWTHIAKLRHLYWRIQVIGPDKFSGEAAHHKGGWDMYASSGGEPSWYIQANSQENAAIALMAVTAGPPNYQPIPDVPTLEGGPR